MSTSAGSSRYTRAAGAIALAVLLCGAGGPACVTTSEGDKMRADIADLRAKLDKIEKRDKEYTEQVAKLRDFRAKLPELFKVVVFEGATDGDWVIGGP